MVITRSKRRRLDEEEARRQQQPPPPTDFISRLPDDVLGAVITRLPSAAGARTQLLSRRWRPLWRYAPLNLEADTLAAAEAILAGHRGGSPCRRLCLTWRGSLETFPKAANEILRLAGLDGLQELELFYMPTKSYIRAYGSMDNRRNPAPLSMSRFSPTLRVLTVCCYGSTLEFPEVAAAAALGNFPHLEQLTLKAVIVPECTLHGILSGCPALQSLALHCNNGYRQLRISSRTLRSLGISGAQWGEVVIEDAPLLERIFQDGPVYHQTIRVIQAPKLKMLGYLRDRISRFVPPYFYFEERKLVSLRTVKILALHVASDSVYIVIDFLRCFPCVERLYIVLTH